MIRDCQRCEKPIEVNVTPYRKNQYFVCVHCINIIWFKRMKTGKVVRGWNPRHQETRREDVNISKVVE